MNHSTSQDRIGYGICLQWVFVTFVGFLVSLYWIEVGEKPDIWLVEGAIGGAVIGLAQWFVLRQRVAQSGWWVLASIVSWGLLAASGFSALGWVAPRTLYIPMRVAFGVVQGAEMGALIGMAQWLVLRKQIPRAWRWIVASSVGWSVGLTLGWVLGGILRVVTRLFLGEVVGLALGWIVVAAITGVVLQELVLEGKAQ